MAANGARVLARKAAHHHSAPVRLLLWCSGYMTSARSCYNVVIEYQGARR